MLYNYKRYVNLHAAIKTSFSLIIDKLNLHSKLVEGQVGSGFPLKQALKSNRCDNCLCQLTSSTSSFEIHTKGAPYMSKNINKKLQIDSLLSHCARKLNM